MEACEAFCKEHDLFLEKSRSFYDEGKSGFRGKHRTEGALSKFLELVEKGRVPQGSVMIVEAFDRLSREDTLTAFNLFTNLLKAGLDLVTLVDRQWYSRDTINENMGQLFLSVGALWSAHNYSALLAGRVGTAWAQKQKLAREQKKPMTKNCPAWLRMSDDGQRYETIPERVRIVRLMFWLRLRGWGPNRIKSLFNRHRDRVPVWGAHKNKAEAWHSSYIKLILGSRAVLGEFTLHTSLGGVRRASGEAVKGYYPTIVDEDAFLRVQNRAGPPKGPLPDAATNLFQGLLHDGDFPDYRMWFRDHSRPPRLGQWAYAVSDHRRVYPDEPIFSWRYLHLERLILGYLVDLDWSSLTSTRNAEVSRLRKDLEAKDAQAAELGRQVKRLVEVAKAAGDVQELAREITEITSRRGAVQAEAKDIRQQILAKHDFTADDAAALIRKLAADRATTDSRKSLREALRGQVARIDLFRRLPEEMIKGLGQSAGKPTMKLQKFMKARCARLLFANGAQRWVVNTDDDQGRGIRFDGATLPPSSLIDENRDAMGGTVLVDKRTPVSIHANPIKKDAWRKARASQPRPTDESQGK
jgi:hypothetical protein